MAMYNSFELPFQYSKNDTYIRAIRRNMIRKNGEIKISAFKSNKGGVSVTRTNDAVFDKAMAYMLLHFEGLMASFPVIVCKQNAIHEEHSPSPGHNLHHWELYGDQNHEEMTPGQIAAVIEVCTIT